MKRHGTKSATSDEGRDPAIKDLHKSVRRLRILTASLFALTIVLNLTPAAATIKAKITGEDVVDGSLTGADIQDRSLTGDDVASSSIDGFNIALDTLVGGHVVDDSLTGLDIDELTLDIDAGVIGYEIVVDRELGIAPNEAVSASAFCPLGKVPVGGGYQVDNASVINAVPLGALVTEARPLEPPPIPPPGEFKTEGWTARMFNDGIYTLDLSVYAICVIG
jgi:hypothetical protein